MIRSLIIIVLLCSLPTRAADLLLAIGESTNLPVEPGEDIHIGHSHILSVKDMKSYLILKGKKTGKTYIEIKNKKRMVIVVHKKYFHLLQKLNEKIHNSMGLSLNIEPDSCQIEGELLSLKDWLDIEEIQRSFKSSCLFRAKIHPLIKEEVSNYWLNKMKNEKWKNLNLNIDSSFEITSPQLNKKKQEEINKSLQPWGLRLKVFQGLKDRSPLVQVKLLLAEVSKSKSNQFGFNWEQNYQAKILPGHNVIGNWLVQLQSLEAQGQGKILSSPTLVTQSGGEAEFLAGGEFPIRIQGFHNSQLQWKKHGLLFKIYPEVDVSDRIFLKIESEVSLLDSQNSVEGIPGLKVSRLNSQFNLNSGQTIILSGLIQQRMGQQESGVSFIKNLPIIGELFKSRNFQNEKSELVVFIQPLIFDQYLQPQFPKPELLDDQYRAN